jgi:hypothetical protein
MSTGAPHSMDDGTELDFWIGTWEVSWAEGGHGTNRIDRILGDRVIHETFEEAGDAPDALHGQSWSVYDAARGLWRQTWVDDQGSYLDLVGTHVDGWFAFERAAPERAPEARQRMVFRDVDSDRFRWTWESSPDGGATWVVRWEIAYRRRI